MQHETSRKIKINNLLVIAEAFEKNMLFEMVL